MKVKRERGWTGNSWGGISLGPPDPGPNGGKQKCKHSHSVETCKCWMDDAVEEKAIRIDENVTKVGQFPNFERHLPPPLFSCCLSFSPRTFSYLRSLPFSLSPLLFIPLPQLSAFFRFSIPFYLYLSLFHSCFLLSFSFQLLSITSSVYLFPPTHSCLFFFSVFG